MASSTMITSSACTVINVLATVIPSPSIDTDTVVASMSVMACPTILASVWHQLALIHIFSAVLTCEMGRTLAVVGVHTINTYTTILAVVPWTVIDVVLTMGTCEAWQTATIVGSVSLLHTGASILAR